MHKLKKIYYRYLKLIKCCRLSRAKFLVVLDLLMGCHQVEIYSRDMAKTAFLTRFKLNVYNVMPVGLCKAPASFND